MAAVAYVRAGNILQQEKGILWPEKMSVDAMLTDFSQRIILTLQEQWMKEASVFARHADFDWETHLLNWTRKYFQGSVSIIYLSFKKGSGRNKKFFYKNTIRTQELALHCDAFDKKSRRTRPANR